MENSQEKCTLMATKMQIIKKCTINNFEIMVKLSNYILSVDMNMDQNYLLILENNLLLNFKNLVKSSFKRANSL